MVATKAALSIRIDALFGVASKSSVDVASLGVEKWLCLNLVFVLLIS